METIIIILVVLAALVVLIKIGAGLITRRQEIQSNQPLPDNLKTLLSEHVVFYNELDDVGKNDFERRVQSFLSRVRITGVKTEVEDIDKVLVAASAIIPIFGFADWEYINLNEVLLYPDSFNNDTFAHEGAGRDTLGVIGTGPYQNIMILSRHGLREGFANKTGKTNVAIHEFVHLIDKTDGDVDGVPELIMSKQYILPWLDMMQKNIREIMKNKSDINPYGATSQAEFFAVVSEYFFERPDLLQSKHPELYDLLAGIFRQNVKI